MNLIELTSKSVSCVCLIAIAQIFLFSAIALANTAVGEAKLLKIGDFPDEEAKHETGILKTIPLKEMSAAIVMKVDLFKKSKLHSLQHFLDRSKGWMVSGTSFQKTSGNAQYARSVADMIAESNRYLSDKVEWDLMGTEDGVTVWKLKRSSLEMNKADCDWPCVKSSVKIEIIPTHLLNYLLDSDKVNQYNKYVAVRSDVETISCDTKIVWNRMNIPIGIKSYDFCTLMHNYIKQDTGDIMVITKGIEHPSVPIQKNFGRSEKIIGVNILKRTKSSDCKDVTEITCISHQRYANTPPFMIEKSMMRGKMNYLRNLRKIIEDQ